MQQAMVSSIKAQQYEDALSIADQLLKSKPNDIIVQELRKTLAEKVSLDENIVDDSSDEDSSSDTESLSDQEQTSDSEDDASESGSDSQDLVATHPGIPLRQMNDAWHRAILAREGNEQADNTVGVQSVQGPPESVLMPSQCSSSLAAQQNCS
ncbi:hypothetical protein WJX82_011682 [Trebouxia sp. C0006]